MVENQHKNTINKAKETKHSYTSRASPGCPNTVKLQENYLQSNLMKMLQAFKEEMNESLEQVQENANKQVKEMNKTLQGLKVEIEAMKKKHKLPILQMVNLWKRTGQQMQASPTGHRRRKRGAQA